MGLFSDRRLPDWPEEGTDPSVRDADEEYPTSQLSGQAARRAVGGGIGSSSLAGSPVVLVPAGGSSFISSRMEQQSDSSAKSLWKDLDDFYASEDEDTEEEETDEEGDDVNAAERLPSAKKAGLPSDHDDGEILEDEGEDEENSSDREG